MTMFAKGILVEHTVRQEWGPGKIVHISGDIMHVIFRDNEREMAKRFPLQTAFLRTAAVQTDSILDNLPPLVEKDGRWMVRRSTGSSRRNTPRLSLESLKDKFLHEFSAGFADPKYFEAERDFKLRAHLHFQTELGDGQISTALQTGEIAALANKVSKIVGPLIIVNRFEHSALRDALSNDEAAALFFSALSNVLRPDQLGPAVFDHYAGALTSLPAKARRVASWPIATVLLYIADPARHMFLKPVVTNNAADAIGFDLQYRTTPNWTTYSALLRMSDTYLELLRPMGARDFIDVQSFIYVTCGGYDFARDRKAATRGQSNQK